MKTSNGMTQVLCIIFFFSISFSFCRVAQAADKETLERLEQLIRQQQQQLDEQGKAIGELKRQIEELKSQSVSEQRAPLVTEKEKPEKEKVLEEPELGPKEEEKVVKEPEPEPEEEQMVVKEPAPAPEKEQVVVKEPEPAPEEEQKVVKEAETRAEEERPAITLPGDLVRSGGEKVRVQLYGQVNRGVLYANDGDEDNWFFVDNENSNTRIGFLGIANVSADVNIAAWIELGLESSSSFDVSQREKSTDFDIDERHLEAYVISKRFGEGWLGFGDTASNETSEVDISGTSVVGYSGVADTAGGQFFFDSDNDSLSNTRIREVFTNMDGLGREDRLRYDTPTFYGFRASASASSGNAVDVALRYSAQFGVVKLAAAAAYADPSGTLGEVKDRVNGSVSALHGSGVSATFAAGFQNLEGPGRDDAKFFYGKLGLQRDFFKVGTTAVSVDYGRSDDVAQNGDEATTLGIQFVQNFSKYGTEYYLGLRNYHLDREDADFKDINVMLSGVRVKF